MSLHKSGHAHCVDVNKYSFYCSLHNKRSLCISYKHFTVHFCVIRDSTGRHRKFKHCAIPHTGTSFTELPCMLPAKTLEKKNIASSVSETQVRVTPVTKRK